MSRTTANDRVRRMLAIIPWVATRPDGVPLDDLCQRFQVDRRTLLTDLTTASFVGVAPYTPDTQVDVTIEGDRVRVRLPQWFDRPLRLTPEQALALVAAGQGLLAVEGADPAGPLARALAKLSVTLGLEDGEALDVNLGGSGSPVVGELRQAIATSRRVRISYYAYGRDAHTSRVVEPRRLYTDRGQLYLWAHCCQALAERSFRIDRIEHLEVLDEVSTAPPETGRPGFDAPAGAPRIVLDLQPPAHWVAEHYPVEAAEDRRGGVRRVTVAVTGRAWLERLLLRLGPDAVVVRADGDLAGVGRDAARRVLARYRPSHGSAEQREGSARTGPGRRLD